MATVVAERVVARVVIRVERRQRARRHGERITAIAVLLIRESTIPWSDT